MAEEKHKRLRESWCIIEYVLILVEIVEMNMNTIGSYCNPPLGTALVAAGFYL